jgi:translation initiation factor 2B subunit (eIF-2B alpha/beta/delta family)
MDLWATIPKKFQLKFNKIVGKLARREWTSDFNCIQQVSKFLKDFLESIRLKSNTDVSFVVRVVSYMGRELEHARPIELPISNVVRRVLHIIRTAADT